MKQGFLRRLALPRFFIKTILFAGLIFSLQVNAQNNVFDKVEVSSTNVAGSFPMVHLKKAATIYYDKNDAKVVEIVVQAFQSDVKALTGLTPSASSTTDNMGQYPVIVGTLGKSALIDALIKSGKVDARLLKGNWEQFSITLVQNPMKGVKTALVVIGSDRRGTAYGIFELSKKMGISPWIWWADVRPEHRESIYLTGNSISKIPSIKYRGIFINDEDWGLQPWAAKNMDTDVKDIGPKTYAKVFELLLRLKGNYIWPAMHPCTKAFYYYKENPKVADDYAIVVGGSHCEPMLRNNVFEWAENFEHEYGKKPGEWRYDLNKNEMDRYWADRVKESTKYESVYTVGMRGIHDGSMPGPKDRNEKVKLLDSVITGQRKIFANYFTTAVAGIPQIFCPYKEVLSLYQAGLRLPDDVTIVWADDNHGYIRQLSNAKEQKRSGGSGVYYHLSYWGAPNDYLWLSTISPALISYELTKAYQYKADRLWVMNVGDIKPAEMELQFAMDLAYDVNRWKPENADQYAEYWAGETFGKSFAKEISQIKAQYYRLAQAAKPEHMLAVSFTDAEATQRLKDYEAVYLQAKQLENKVPARLKDAYFELILYPVQGSYLMNQKILFAKKSLELAARNDKGAFEFAKKAEDAFAEIKMITKKYNQEIAGGKWNGMMSDHPRDQAVFKMPLVAKKLVDTAKKDSNYSFLSKTVIQASKFIEATSPTGKVAVIKGLGNGGDGVTQLPLNFPSLKETELSKAPCLTYKIDYVGGGMLKFTVKCLPTQAVFSGGKVRYAIKVDDQEPQIVNIAPASENNIWKENVLKGYAQGVTSHAVRSSHNSILKIYLLDPGIVINQIEIAQ